ncbi:hypothetical protein HDU76_008979 [Blyttiomyces sp. JEL0837]|nr:hypothetical protein HDU76_008979 [Blyttiomyces sp. JEL0837]
MHTTTGQHYALHHSIATCTYSLPQESPQTPQPYGYSPRQPTSLTEHAHYEYNPPYQKAHHVYSTSHSAVTSEQHPWQPPTAAAPFSTSHGLAKDIPNSLQQTTETARHGGLEESKPKIAPTLESQAATPIGSNAVWNIEEGHYNGGSNVNPAMVDNPGPCNDPKTTLTPTKVLDTDMVKAEASSSWAAVQGVLSHLQKEKGKFEKFPRAFDVEDPLADVKYKVLVEDSLDKVTALTDKLQLIISRELKVEKDSNYNTNAVIFEKLSRLKEVASEVLLNTRAMNGYWKQWKVREKVIPLFTLLHH